jgi:hypothetical protein
VNNQAWEVVRESRGEGRKRRKEREKKGVESRAPQKSLYLWSVNMKEIENRKEHTCNSRKTTRGKAEKTYQSH